MTELKVQSPKKGTRSHHPGAVRLALVLASELIFPCGGQNQQAVPGQINPRSTNSSIQFGQDQPDPIEEEKRLRLLNAQRQKAMVADAAKLLKLAGELNAEVASPDSAPFTLEQLHKINEIEKLAHSVKDKMSTSVRGLPAFVPPTFSPIR